jgi:glycosyltransferase involved in cell wall biosynthesis
MIIPSLDPSSGGTSQVIRNIIPELDKLGIQNEVVCLDDPAASFLAKDPFIVNAVGPAKGPWGYSKKLVPWLIENLERFDVIIIHALWLYHGFGFKKAIKQYKKQMVQQGSPAKLPRFYVMPHGMLDPYFQQASERKIKALRNWVYWKLIESKLVNSADGLLFTCKTELLLARKSFSPYHPNLEVNVGFGVEPPPAFETAMATAFFEKCPEVKGHSFILSLSRIHEKKGIDHLIEAYNQLLEINEKQATIDNELPLPKLVIAGPGLDTLYGKKMQQLVASSKKLQESVFFPGMLSGDSKWGAFYQSDTFILPSHQENFGIAVAEALACSKPVLISNQVNIWREIIDAGGGLVEADTTEGTRKLLESWQSLSKEDKLKMGRKAQASFISDFSIVPVAKRFAQLVVGY